VAVESACQKGAPDLQAGKKGKMDVPQGLSSGHNDFFAFLAAVERIPPHSVSTPVFVFIPPPGTTPAT